MYLFKLIEITQELEDQLGPMAEVFIKCEDEELVSTFRVSNDLHEDGKAVVVIE